jgi:hypothetical protein
MCIDTRKLSVQTIKGVYRGVLVYLNDILICAKTQEEHDKLLQQVLQILEENQFYSIIKV